MDVTIDFASGNRCVDWQQSTFSSRSGCCAGAGSINHLLTQFSQREGAVLLGARLRVTDFVVPIAVSGSPSCRLEAGDTVVISMGLQPAALAGADWKAARQGRC